MREENIQRLDYCKVTIYDPNYLHLKFLFQDLKDAIVQYAKGDVLDIGCGNKPYKSLFTNCSKYIGCDIVQSSHENVDIVCPSTNIPVDDNQFDTIFSTQVLEHVEDHSKMLDEAYRTLKSGGKIILSAPMCWQHHEIPYDFFRFTRYGLTYLFEKAGFKIIKIKANGGKWVCLGQISHNVIRSSISGKKAIHKKILSVLYKFIFKYLMDLLFLFLEKIDKKDDFLTLNFVVVAEKL